MRSLGFDCMLDFRAHMRSAANSLLLAVALVGAAGCGDPQPDHYGCFVVDHRKLQELTRTKDTPFESVPATNVVSEGAYFMIYGDYGEPILFKTKEEGGRLTPTDETVTLEIAPVKGETEMHSLRPSEPLESGVYLLSIIGCTDNRWNFRCYFPIGVNIGESPVPSTETPPATAQLAPPPPPPSPPPQETPVSAIGDDSPPEKDSLLAPITDPKIAHHLTRKFWRTASDDNPIVVVDLDGQKAWINLRGRDVELPLEALEGDPDSGEVGNRFSRKFSEGEVSLLVQYAVLSSYTNQEMGCQRTDYQVNIDLSSNYGSERIEPESYGEGC